MCERKVESESGGKRKEAAGVCSNRTVEHIASGTRLLLLLQMVWRRFRQIDVSLYSLPVVYIYVVRPYLYEAICDACVAAICLFSLNNVS